jgi:hypothetical protein
MDRPTVGDVVELICAIECNFDHTVCIVALSSDGDPLFFCDWDDDNFEYLCNFEFVLDTTINLD